MASKRTWRQTCRLARTDKPLCEIALAICSLNRRMAQGEDGLAGQRTDLWHAFQRHTTAIGLTVPNSAYWSAIFLACLQS